MSLHLVKWFALLGAVLLIAGVWAVRFQLRAFRQRDLGRAWLAVALCTIVGGVALGGALVDFTAYASPTVKTFGFPFLEAVFELREGRWVDYVGPLTLPAAAGNFAVGVLTPQLVLATVMWGYLRRRRHAT